ncbi:MAG: RNA polymerase sigma factor [Motilibacteraceae bacterium]
MSEDEFGDALRRARSGDPVAFATLWRATNPALVRYLRVVAGDDADDLASETWLSAVRALSCFDGDERGFRSWLVTIARRKHLDLVRSAPRRRERSSGDDEVLAGGDVVADVAETVVAEHASREALALLRALPPEQAELVALRVVVGLDVAEVAALTGRTPGSVRVAVHRALRRLGDLMGAEPARRNASVAGPVLGAR